MATFNQNSTLKALGSYSFSIGLSIRLILMIALPMLMDDGILLQGVKYTDIDYDVFTDAAEHVANGKSPFLRHTYRYTPFLAVILSWASSSSTWRHPKYFGRFLFCVADACCGFIIVKLRRRSRRVTRVDREGDCHTKIQDALWWLYNPLPINICTRGSGESLIVLLPVLFTLVIVMSSSTYVRRSSIFATAALGGVIHGTAVHAKLYPIIYTASFMAYLSLQEQSLSLPSKTVNTIRKGWLHKMEPLAVTSSINTSAQSNRNQYPFPWGNPKRLYQLVKLWIQRLLFTPSSIIFLTCFLVTFGILTYLAVLFYGQEALDEGLLYHFSRVDHRHNYSMFWYWIYLARGRVAQIGVDLSTSSLAKMGKGLLIPQIVLLLYSSLGIAPYDLPFALFVQTFSFVSQNKVMTAQYFTWYLVLLPLCSDRIKWKSYSMFLALGLLGLSIVTWLGCAFLLEMKGMTVHLQVWLASVGFFIANVNLLRVIIIHYDVNGNDLVEKHKSQ